jgi:hypothetical protein
LAARLDVDYLLSSAGIGPNVGNDIAVILFVPNDMLIMVALPVRNAWCFAKDIDLFCGLIFVERNDFYL